MHAHYKCTRHSIVLHYLLPGVGEEGDSLEPRNRARSQRAKALSSSRRRRWLTRNSVYRATLTIQNLGLEGSICLPLFSVSLLFLDAPALAQVTLLRGPRKSR